VSVSTEEESKMNWPRLRWFALAAVVSVGLTAGCSGCDDRKEPLPAVDAAVEGDGAETGGRDSGDLGGVDSGGSDTGADDTSGGEGDADGMTADGDGGTHDAGGETGPSDGGGSDTDQRDTGPIDTGMLDTGMPDTVPADTGVVDTGPVDTGPTPPQGLSTPCSNGTGWTLFKFHYEKSAGTSPRIDVWDAACSYSFAPGSACNVQEIRGPSFTSRTHAVIVSSREYVQVRFSVQGLQFSRADLYVKARSYSTTASTDVEAWAPLHGSNTGGLVDNDFTYDWYHIPWTNYLKPGDSPSSTAVRLLDAPGGSSEVAIKAVELCLQ
jgi:hypothetical protein